MHEIDNICFGWIDKVVISVKEDYKNRKNIMFNFLYIIDQCYYIIFPLTKVLKV